MLAAEAEERQNRHERDAWLAWHIAGLGRAKKMPALKELMGRKEKPKDMESRLKATLKAALPIKGKS